MSNVEKIPIREVVILKGRRPAWDIAPLAESIRQLGLLSPIAITEDRVLVAGRNRLEACKSLGWEGIPAIVLKLDRLNAELAEIDEKCPFTG
jgi:ParB-like chromosome segregation protein Spo0J